MQTGSVNDAVYSIYKYILINNLFVTEQTEAQDGSNDAEDSSNENNNKNGAGDDDGVEGSTPKDKPELGEVKLDSLLQKVLDTNAAHLP